MAYHTLVRLVCNLIYVTIFSCLMLTNYAHAGCKFPEYLQSNVSDRDWKGGIKDQNTEVTLHISISDTMIVAMSTDESATSYTRVCVREERGKYLVAHEEPGQVGSLFTCVQFVQRTDNVFQMRQAPVGTSMSRNICNDNNMELYPWLIIDMSHVAGDVRPVPFSGGFSVRIYDKKHAIDVCAVYHGQTRIESECVDGEGLYFYYRYRRCVPRHIYMYEEQRTLCLGHWQEGSDTFVLLRHDDREQYMWILRYPTGLGSNLNMILFNDLVADTGLHPMQTRNYLRLDAVLDPAIPAHALCVDEYEYCTSRKNVCDDGVLSMACPRTCGICNAVRPHVCTFSNNYQGQWYNAVEPGSLALTVNDTTLTTYSNNVHEQLHCIEWDPEPTSRPKAAQTRMLVRQFNNGCKPRFSCVQFMQQSSSALFFKLSQGLAWPFTSIPSQPIDCSNFMYEEEELSLSPNKFRSRNLNLVYIRASTTVSCDLPRTEGEYVAIFRGGVQCTSSIVQNISANSFQLQLTDCTPSNLGGTYACADNTRMFARRDKIVITRSGSNQDLVYCWMFPRRQHDVFYLVGPSDCNEALRKRLSRGRLKPLIAFTRSGVIPQLDYDDDKFTNELPSVITDHSVNQPIPTHSTNQTPTPIYNMDDLQNMNWSYPVGNVTDSEGEMKITATSIAVVSVVLVMAVVQTLCPCSC